MHAPCLFFLMSPKNYYLLFGELHFKFQFYGAEFFAAWNGIIATDHGTIHLRDIERQ